MNLKILKSTTTSALGKIDIEGILIKYLKDNCGSAGTFNTPSVIFVGAVEWNTLSPTYTVEQFSKTGQFVVTLTSQTSNGNIHGVNVKRITKASVTVKDFQQYLRKTLSDHAQEVKNFYWGGVLAPSGNTTTLHIEFGDINPGK